MIRYVYDRFRPGSENHTVAFSMLPTERKPHVSTEWGRRRGEAGGEQLLVAFENRLDAAW